MLRTTEKNIKNVCCIKNTTQLYVAAWEKMRASLCQSFNRWRHVFYVSISHSCMHMTSNILQFASIFCNKKKKIRALHDKTTAPLVMQIWFGKWVQVMVFSLVWCIPQSTGNTQFQHAFPQKRESNLHLTTANSICCACLFLYRET